MPGHGPHDAFGAPSAGGYPDVDRMSYEELLALQDSIGYVKVGVPQEIVDRLPVLTVYTPSPATAEPCSVCLEAFAVGDKLRCLPCEHTFHRHCIDPWLADHKHCPLCKRDVAELGSSVGGALGSRLRSP